MIADRIPDLSDIELERLNANALRLAESGTSAQREQALALLPLLGAALGTRRQAQAEAQKTARRATRRKAAVEQQAEAPDEYD